MDSKNKICPLRNTDCAMEKCAWWVESECAMRSIGYLDHTLQAVEHSLGAKVPHAKQEAEE